MSDFTAKPHTLKQVNLSSVRKVIKSKGSATRAEIAWETKISSTTVRSLLIEMQQNGEIESIGYDESNGGRKAERYCFKPDRYYGVSFCIADDVIHYLIINICGEIIENGKLDYLENDIFKTISLFLDHLITKKDIKSIGIGVPGIVDGKSYFRKNENSELFRIDIGASLHEKYGIPIVIENDLNAITIGFVRCYNTKYPKENPDRANMVFLFFEEDCISAGFISEGKVIRGHHNFAGEIGMIPETEEMTLADYMAGPINDVEYASAVVRILSWFCGILNPKYIALGGPAFRESCIGPVCDDLYSLLPEKMYAEVLYSSDIWHDYYEGMAFLTASKIFNEVEFIKK